MMRIFDTLQSRKSVAVAGAATAVLVVCLAAQPALSRVVAAWWAPAAPQESTGSANRPYVISVYLTPYGIEVPAEMNLTAGEYLIDVRNRSGFETDLTFTLTKVGEREVATTSLGRGKQLARSITLESGEYSITEASHPEWEIRFDVK